MKSMKSNVILLILTILNIVNGYTIKCSKYYTVKNGDDCVKVALNNEISKYYLITLNPDMNCKNLVKYTNVCVKGKINITKDGSCGNGKGSCPFGECCSKDGKCGSSPTFCGTGCKSKYGHCESTSKDMKHIEDVKNFKDISKSFDTEAINDIKEHLNMNEKEAKEFYTNVNKGISYFTNAFENSINSKHSVEKCIELCENANKQFISLADNKNNNFNISTYNQYLKSHSEPVIDKNYLLNNCKSNCYIIKEIEENNTKDNKNKMTLIKEKRFINTCEPASEGRITLVTSNYKNGVAKYRQESNSAVTAVGLVNGCSIPLIGNIYNSDNYGLFVPVCNSHDVCYNCQIGKDVCDNRLLNNSKELCKIYNRWWEIGDYITCLGEAEIFYAALRYSSSAQEAYDACNVYNTDPACALCGTPIIQDELLETPFYV